MTEKQIKKSKRRPERRKAHPNRASPKQKGNYKTISFPKDSIPGKMLADIKCFARDKISSLQRLDRKKLFLLNFPYLVFAYIFNEIVWLYRISGGGSAWEKFVETLNYFERAFENPFPSLYYMDLFYGVIGGVAVKLIVYYRAKNAKKYRQGVEYGSARWSA